MYMYLIQYDLSPFVLFSPFTDAILSSHSSITRPIHPSGGFFGDRSRLPMEPRNLSAVIVSKRFVTLSWLPPGSNDGVIIAYSVYWKEEDSPR